MQLKNVMKIQINNNISYLLYYDLIKMNNYFLRIFILFSIISLISCGMNKVDEAYVDKRLNELNKVYQSLCEKKRNDNLKLSFQKLEDDIFNLGQEVSESKDLSYEEQIKLSEYYIVKLKTYPDLYSLIETHNINCW